MEELTNKYFIDAYLKEVAKRSPGSFINNKLSIRDLVKYIEKPFLNITMMDIQNYLINEIDKKEIKKSTKNTKRYMLKAFFTFIQKTLLLYDIDYKNPVPSKRIFQFTTNLDDIKHIEDAEIQILRINQIKKILVYCKNNLGFRDFVLIALVIFTGARISEIRTIRRKDINFKERYFQTGFVSGARKTTLHTNKGLLFFFPTSFKQFIAKYLESCNKCEIWLFPGYKEKPISRAMTQDIMTKLRNEMGFHFTWHTFRRTRITEMSKMDCHLEIREMLLNHTPSSVEGQSYLKLTTKEKRKLYDKFSPYKKLSYF